MAEISQNGLKTLWEKEKLLVTSNFSFSHSVFRRLVLQTRKNQGLFGKGLTTLKKEPFENIVGKGENAGNQYFLLFPTMFSTIPKTNLNFFSNINFMLSKCFQIAPVFNSAIW